MFLMYFAFVGNMNTQMF